MTKIILYRWDDNDPFPMAKRIDEAFSRVQSFCPELLQTLSSANTAKSPQLTAYNRVVTNGEFGMDDLIALLDLALNVADRIDEKYGNYPVAGPQSDVVESIKQARDNVVEVMVKTVDYVKNNVVYTYEFA